MAGGAGGQPDAAMLEQILAELGISPEQAQQKVSEYRRQKRAMADCATSMNSGKKKPKWQPKTAADREKYSRMKQVITEITGRSSK
jgi:hypothetical protein